MLRVLILSVVLFTACGSGQKPAAVTPPIGQIITLTDSLLVAGGTDTVRFGHLHSGEIAVKQLRLQNNSSKPVVLINYRRNCGCISLEYEKQPVAPGGELPASLSFDSRGEYGWQLRTIDLVLAGAEKPLKIFVEADVE